MNLASIPTLHTVISHQEYYYILLTATSCIHGPTREQRLGGHRGSPSSSEVRSWSCGCLFRSPSHAVLPSVSAIGLFNIEFKLMNYMLVVFERKKNGRRLIITPKFFSNNRKKSIKVVALCRGESHSHSNRCIFKHTLLVQYVWSPRHPCTYCYSRFPGCVVVVNAAFTLVYESCIAQATLPANCDRNATVAAGDCNSICAEYNVST